MHRQRIDLNGFENPFAELDKMIIEGVGGVQKHLPRAKSPNIPQDSLAYDALTRIHDLNEALGVADRVSDPFDFVWGGETTHPKQLIVEEVVVAIGVSPELGTPAKAHHINTWIDTSSSGPGRGYPTNGIARMSAASILSEACYVHTPAIDELIRIVDRERPIVGLLVKLDDVAKRLKNQKLV